MLVYQYTSAYTFVIVKCVTKILNSKANKKGRQHKRFQSKEQMKTTAIFLTLTTTWLKRKQFTKHNTYNKSLSNTGMIAGAPEG